MPVASDEEIETFAANLVAGNPHQPFVVKADHRVRYERIDMVLDALKRANAREVYLLSEQLTTSAGSE